MIFKWFKYEGHPESKERFDTPRYFFNSNTETQYTNFGTYLCLLLLIVAVDIKTLVVHWHQFVFTLVIPCGRRQNSSALHRLWSVYQQGPPSFLETGKSPTVSGPGCKEDARICSNVIPHAFLETGKVRWCQVRTVRRMLEDVPMEFLTQQGLCLPGSMRTCIVVHQNSSTWDLASSAI